MSVKVKAKPGSKKKPADAEITVEESNKELEGKDLPQTTVEKVEVPEEIVAPNDGGLDAEVEFGLQAVVPTGDYQNIRVNVGVKCRCEADTDVIEETFQFLKAWVDQKVTEVVTEITNG